MGEKRFIVTAEIYNTELPQKIYNELSSNLPELDKEYYDLDIVFSKSVYKPFYETLLKKGITVWTTQTGFHPAAVFLYT